MALKRISYKEVVLIGALIAIASASPAYAYLDPSSGAAISTAIMGFFAAIAFTARKYFHRIMRKITGKSPKDETDKSATE